MRAVVPNLGTFTGSAEEIAKLLTTLRAEGVLPAVADPPPRAHVQVQAPEISQARLVLQQPGESVQDAVGAAARRLRDVPTVERLLYDYRATQGISRGTLSAYARVADDFAQRISPKNPLDATVDDVRAYERACMSVCAHLHKVWLGGRGVITSVPRVRCGEDLFPLQLTPPETCATTCPKYALQTAGPGTRLRALKHFYDELQDRGLVTSNPVTIVARKHATRAPGSDEPKKYSPTLDEVRALVRALLDQGEVLGAAMVMCLAKWGRRPKHTVALQAADLVNVLPGSTGPAHVTFKSAREAVRRRNGSTRTKLRGNLGSPIDGDMLTFLRDTYMPYRQRESGFAWNEGPLLPGKFTRRAFDQRGIQEWVLDKAMRHLRDTAATSEDRARWTRHLSVRDDTHITPGCFRHYFTDELRRQGFDDLRIDIFRGDKISGAKSAYSHVTIEEICATYKMPALH